MPLLKDELAITEIEQKYGSVEDFAWAILEKYPEVLEGDHNIQALAGKTGVSTAAAARTMRSPTFRAAMTRLVVAHEYSMADEIKHARLVSKTAQNPAKGGIQAAIAAREHLARLEGRPLHGTKEDTIIPIQIVFGDLAQRTQDVETVDVVATRSGDTAVQKGYQPARAGDLPPPGARRKYLAPSEAADPAPGLAPGEELDFYSAESRAAEASPEPRQEDTRTGRRTAIKLPPPRNPRPPREE